MDGSRFDALTKCWSPPHSRRGLLGGLLAGALGGLRGTSQGEAGRKPRKARAKQKRHRRGVNAQADCNPQTQCCNPSYPVFCGTRSDGSPACCNVGTQCCPQGSSFICCSLELNTYCCANNFCCLQHQTCSAVGCAGCPTGQTTCPADRTACVDLQTDPFNCGRCGNPCSGGSDCVAGSCVCQSPTPDVCNGQCVDLQTDDQNCGSCGNACQGGSRCEGGVCECASGDPPCGGELCCNALLGETCTTNFGNPICCVPASVCGGSCCTGGCCVNAKKETCGTPCGTRCCPDGKSCVTQQHGGNPHFACR
jgi:hypothetical protein